MPLTCGWCDAAALQVCVQLPHGCKLMGWELPNNCHTSFHMFLTVLLLLLLLLLRRRAAAVWQVGCSGSICGPPPTNGSESLRSGLWQHTPLMLAHKVPSFRSRKCGGKRAPPPGHGDDRLLGGAAKSGAGAEPIMTPSLRWAIIFPPGAHCAGSKPEMSCPITEHLLTIAPQSSERAENCNKMHCFNRSCDCLRQLFTVIV